MIADEEVLGHYTHLIRELDLLSMGEKPIN